MTTRERLPCHSSTGHWSLIAGRLGNMLRPFCERFRRTVAVALLCAACLAAPRWLVAQDQVTSPPWREEFRQRSAAVVADREAEVEESSVKLEAALSILDGVVLAGLNSGQTSDLAGLNQTLREYLAAGSPLAEEYSLQPFQATPGLFVLTANFSPIGPGALRFYARHAGNFRLVSSLTRFADSRLDDSFIRFVPIPEAWQAVFLTVSGRTDRWRTGTFAVWRLSEGGFSLLWEREALPLSEYRWQGNRFILDYCAETDEQKASVCRRPAHEVYAWTDNRWQEVSSR